jgi:hypothetical protein
VRVGGKRLNTSDRGRLQIWACDESVEQQVTVTATGELQLGGECISAKTTGPALLEHCTGADDQLWQFRWVARDNPRSVKSSQCGSQANAYDNNYPARTRTVAFDVTRDAWSYNAAVNPKAKPAVYDGDAKAADLFLMPTTPGLGVQPWAVRDAPSGREASACREMIRGT